MPMFAQAIYLLLVLFAMNYEYDMDPLFFQAPQMPFRGMSNTQLSIFIMHNIKFALVFPAVLFDQVHRAGQDSQNCSAIKGRHKLVTETVEYKPIQ